METEASENGTMAAEHHVPGELLQAISTREEMVLEIEETALDLEPTGDQESKGIKRPRSPVTLLHPQSLVFDSQGKVEIQEDEPPFKSLKYSAGSASPQMQDLPNVDPLNQSQQQPPEPTSLSPNTSQIYHHHYIPRSSLADGYVVPLHEPTQFPDTLQTYHHQSFPGYHAAAAYATRYHQPSITEPWPKRSLLAQAEYYKDSRTVTAPKRRNVRYFDPHFPPMEWETPFREVVTEVPQIAEPMALFIDPVAQSSKTLRLYTAKLLG